MGRGGRLSSFLVILALSALLSAVQALKTGSLLGAAYGFGVTVVSITGCWLVSAAIYRMTSGNSPSSRRNKIGIAIFFGGIFALMGACVAPAFLQLVQVSGEGAMKGRLGQMRRAFTRYRAEKSENPPSLEALAGSPDLPELPELWPAGSRKHHAPVNATIALPDGKPTDSGKWAYAVGTSTPVFIDCTHTDNRGGAWASY